MSRKSPTLDDLNRILNEVRRVQGWLEVVSRDPEWQWLADEPAFKEAVLKLHGDFQRFFEGARDHDQNQCVKEPVR